jgi:prephenate dehydrogenase
VSESTPTIKVALIGLDRVSGSVGLALRERRDLRLVGFDRDNGVARLAQQRGLVQEAKWNLIEAVDGADLILLGGPLADQHEWLKAFAPEIREQAVVASLGPLLAPALAWGKEYLPANRHFVAAHPLLNPALLYDGSLGFEAARADLFTNGLWALTAAPECAPEALKLLSDLATLLGAQPYFVDAIEHDGLMAGVDALPALTAVALLRAANASPGWHEMRKAADRGFATATFGLTGLDPAALSLNREAVLHYLDAALTELHSLRDLLAKDDTLTLNRIITDAASRRAQWAAERARGEWEKQDSPAPVVPTLGESLGRLLVGGLFRREKRP